MRLTILILGLALPLGGWLAPPQETHSPGAVPPSTSAITATEWTPSDPGVTVDTGFTAPPMEEVLEAGVVQGVVRVEAREAEEPPMLSPYSRRRYRPPPPSSGGFASPENVVVYVVAQGSDGAAAPGADGSRPTARITQRDRTIIPHVTAIRAGTTIEFPNEDDVFHNLFSLSDPGPFNLGRYPPGDSRRETFERPGVIRMFCDIHSEMTGVIRVLDTPHFTRPDADGRFRIAGVPDGPRTVIAWHDQFGADTVQVTVSPASAARAELQLPR